MTNNREAALEALDKAIDKAEFVKKRYDAFRYPKKDAYEGQLFADFANSINAFRTYLNDAKAALQAKTVTRSEVDVEELVSKFGDAHDSEDYPFKGEDYDLELLTFAFDWLKHQGHLHSKGLLGQPERREVDVERLKIERETGSMMTNHLILRTGNYVSGWNNCIDHLHSKGLLDGDQWQPIKTAPKVGSHILVACPHEHGFVQNIVRFNTVTGEWTNGLWALVHQPTHWMPLPEPPQTGESE